MLPQSNSRSHKPRTAPWAVACSIMVGSLLLPALPALGTIVPTGFIDQLVVGGLSRPVGMAFLPDSRILVVEQMSGDVRLIARRPTGDVLSGPILHIPQVVSGGERGLLGVAVDPLWPARPYVYFHFTGDGDNVWIQMYTASGTLTGATSLNLTLGSPYTILNDCPDESVVHNGGTLRFGLDSHLYVSLGDDLDPCEAQTLSHMKGAILRLKVSALPQPGSGPPPKSLITPADNPFASNPDPEAKLIVHYGLRNPFRFNVDTVTGSLYIADVGESDWEELNEASSFGRNYGWPKREGAHDYPDGAGCPGTNGVNPIFEYDRFGFSASIISGPRYRPGSGTPPHQFPPSYYGDLFIAEYYRGWIRRLKRTLGTWVIAGEVPGQPTVEDWGTEMEYLSDVIQGPDGAIYYVQQFSTGFGPGEVRRIMYVGATSVEEGQGKPAGVSLALAPNPGTRGGSTAIEYAVPRTAEVAIEIYDVTGARIATVLNRTQEAGRYRAAWDGCDESGAGAAAGIYFVRLKVAEEETMSRKLALLP